MPLLLAVLMMLGSPGPSLGAPKPLLVFVTKSDACECVANLCVAGEQVVVNFLGAAGDRVHYERVDLAQDPGAGKKYRAVTLPTILLLDGSGQELARFDSFIKEDQLVEAWNRHLPPLEDRP